jgi:starvation-inducible DNA-binding protein
MSKGTNASLLTRRSRRETPLLDSKIGILDENRRELVDLLNARLADVIDVQTQAKFAHWNVKGSHFFQLHLLFDTIAEHLEEAADSIAERATALGGRANGTARQVSRNSSIKEYDLRVVRGMDHVRTLLHRLAALANASRDAIKTSDELGDRGTSDLFTDIVRTADKDIYFLESHLHGSALESDWTGVPGLSEVSLGKEFSRGNGVVAQSERQQNAAAGARMDDDGGPALDR